MSYQSSHWAHIIGEGYVCALPIASYQVGFIIMAKIGEAAEQLDYYPSITLEQTRIKIVLPDTDTEKAEQIAQIVEDFLPKPNPQEAPSAEAAPADSQLAQKKTDATPKKASKKAKK